MKNLNNSMNNRNNFKSYKSSSHLLTSNQKKAKLKELKIMTVLKDEESKNLDKKIEEIKEHPKEKVEIKEVVVIKKLRLNCCKWNLLIYLIILIILRLIFWLFQKKEREIELVRDY
jgi:hypothetical protein